MGLSFPNRFRVAASATRGYSGEPIINTASYTTGVATVNTVAVLTDGLPVIGTDTFVGIARDSMQVNSAGTVVAHKLNVAVPIANGTKLRAKHKTAASADTDSEVLGLFFDIAIFDLTTAVYTWDPSTADTGAFIVRDGNAAKATLDCVVDARAMRVDIS